MSALMLSDNHLLFLVTAWARYQRNYNITVLGEDMARVATMLKRANHDSVCARYPKDERMPDEFLTFDHRTMPFAPDRVDPVAVIKAAQCFEYQACEVDNWEETPAYKWTQVLIGHAIGALPGWREAEWCIPPDPPPTRPMRRHDLGNGDALCLCAEHDREFSVAAAASAVGKTLETRRGLAASTPTDQPCEICLLPPQP